MSLEYSTMSCLRAYSTFQVLKELSILAHSFPCAEAKDQRNNKAVVQTMHSDQLLIRTGSRLECTIYIEAFAPLQDSYHPTRGKYSKTPVIVEISQKLMSLVFDHAPVMLTSSFSRGISGINVALTLFARVRMLWKLGT